jgi:hypothetical protein
VPEAHHGKTVAVLHDLLKREHRAILMSVEPERGEEAGQVLVNPPNDRVVSRGDTLVVVSFAPVVW